MKRDRAGTGAGAHLGGRQHGADCPPDPEPRRPATPLPDLAVTLFTEALGGAERRVRSGSAALGLCLLFPPQAQDLQAYPITSIELVPVAAPSHPLALESRPLEREVLAEHAQLILTDPENQGGPSHSVVSSRV